MKIVALATLLLALSSLADAQNLSLPSSASATTNRSLPAKGTSMAAVTQAFGAPLQRHAAVGGDTPRHPPITRWDYPGFIVVFENQHVVDAVRPDAPASIARQDGLSP